MRENSENYYRELDNFKFNFLKLKEKGGALFQQVAEEVAKQKGTTADDHTIFDDMGKFLSEHGKTFTDLINMNTESTIRQQVQNEIQAEINNLQMQKEEYFNRTIELQRRTEQSERLVATFLKNASHIDPSTQRPVFPNDPQNALPLTIKNLYNIFNEAGVNPDECMRMYDSYNYQPVFDFANEKPEDEIY